MNNKYHKVLLCVILCSYQLYPLTYPYTSASTLCSQTLSANVLPCHLFLVHSYLCVFFSNGTAGPFGA